MKFLTKIYLSLDQIKKKKKKKKWHFELIKKFMVCIILLINK